MVLNIGLIEGFLQLKQKIFLAITYYLETISTDKSQELNFSEPSPAQVFKSII